MTSLCKYCRVGVNDTHDKKCSEECAQWAIENPYIKLAGALVEEMMKLGAPKPYISVSELWFQFEWWEEEPNKTPIDRKLSVYFDEDCFEYYCTGFWKEYGGSAIYKEGRFEHDTEIDIKKMASDLWKWFCGGEKK